MCLIIIIHYSGLPLFKNIAPAEEKKKIIFNTGNEIVLRYIVHLQTLIASIRREWKEDRIQTRK